jgi:hypothetical protein
MEKEAAPASHSISVSHGAHDEMTDASFFGGEARQIETTKVQG